MHIAIASRIFEPEPSAASFRLDALATGFTEQGDRVRVLTVRPAPANVRSGDDPYRDADRAYTVTRFPVFRDNSGYVRGYFQYLSFDIPLFFRILFGAKQDAIVVEPPPTTVFFASIAAKIRRIPVFAYAADVWSDASESTGAPGAVVKVVRWLEKFAWNNARGVFSVNDGVTDRVREIAPKAAVRTVGNGINTEVFIASGEIPAAAQELRSAAPYVIYTGTASEWQGAEVFVQAIAELHKRGVDLRLVFLGQGTALPELKNTAAELQVPVEFYDPVPPEQAAAWLRGSALSIASIRPGAGYDFAYPTKIFAAWACGTPVVYAGPGPAREVLSENPVLGRGVDHEVTAVADALQAIISEKAESASAIEAWAQENVSLSGVARRAVEFAHTRLS
ncbi:glycosyltransferase family 4 protein [Leucobacter sp. cx-328]|uniref:glycosyltransferase family 4 protein n=1 Tax=unclassified Leucobacter TaxID=2621730 RepID=UPI00165E698E|nr:glycosyltransferase family 4 protein [Leucobacter sp. cx-328]